MIAPRSVLLRMTNVAYKSCTENQNTHVVFNNFFPPENRAVYKIMWKHFVERGRPQMTVWRMRSAVSKAKDTHSEYIQGVPRVKVTTSGECSLC